MTKTVVGLFDTFSTAQTVVQDLVNAGFDRNKVSLVANDSKGEHANQHNDTTDTTNGETAGEKKTAEGAGTGAVAGTMVGGVVGLLVGFGALAIPGIGPVIAAGQLATVLGSAALGAGIGAAAGGLIGALVNLGVPEDEANYYAEGVRRGGSLVMVTADDDNAERAYQIMQDHDAVDIKRRGEDWKQGGWDRFDPNAQPYSSTDIDTMRTGYNNVNDASEQYRGTTTKP